MLIITLPLLLSLLIMQTVFPGNLTKLFLFKSLFDYQIPLFFIARTHTFHIKKILFNKKLNLAYHRLALKTRREFYESPNSSI
jgi:hypothetical protein